MGETIREICILSIICGTVCSIAPENPVKSVMGILSSVILMRVILQPLSELDLSAYASSLAKYHEMEQQLSLEGEDMSTRLNRMVIEEEYSAYIRDKAAELSITLGEVKPEMSWNTEGYWMPVAVSLEISGGIDRVSELQGILESHLGISREKQKCSLIQ